MKYRLRYTDRALSDLAGIAAWLTQPGAGSNAERRLNRIANAIEGIADHPLRFAQNARGRREFSVEGHRVWYRVRGSEVRIIRVFGPGQNRV